VFKGAPRAVIEWAAKMGYDEEFAAANWLFEVDQMPLMLPPAPMKIAAEASATKAISKVYSIRSCPCSSFQKFFSKFTFSHQSFSREAVGLPSGSLQLVRLFLELVNRDSAFGDETTAIAVLSSTALQEAHYHHRRVCGRSAHHPPGGRCEGCNRRNGHRIRRGSRRKFLAGEWPDDPSFRFLVLDDVEPVEQDLRLGCVLSHQRGVGRPHVHADDARYGSVCSGGGCDFVRLERAFREPWRCFRVCLRSEFYLDADFEGVPLAGRGITHK
jgi:hypothetical protein